MTIEENPPEHPPTVQGELSTPTGKREATEPARGWSAFNLVWMSLLAIAIWPLLAIAGCYHLFDHPSEAAILFGSFIACLLFLPIWILGVSDAAGMSLLVLACVLIWLIPIVWLIRHPRGRGFQLAFIAILSGISFAQAALGFLMIWGKGV